MNELRNRLQEINNLLVTGVSKEEILLLEKETLEIFETLKKQGKERSDTLKN